MRAFSRSHVTHQHVFALGLLVALALIEEPDPAQRKGLADGAQRHASEAALLDHLRRFVLELHLGALPGGELEIAAAAWLALKENGGAA